MKLDLNGVHQWDGHLIETERDGPDAWAFFVVHPPNCPTRIATYGLSEHDCVYQFCLNNAGIDAFGDVEELDDETGDWPMGLPHDVSGGRYPLGWVHETSGWETLEHDVYLIVSDVLVDRA